MAQIDGKELLADMDSYLSETAAAEAEAGTALPFETIDEYLSDPQEFGEVTAKLMKKVSAVFDLAVKYNRHSPEYLKSCARLEKGIKYLGSACLMKYALVQHKYPQPMLAELNTANLYTMAAVLFNKLDRALTEYMEEKQAVDDALLDMEYRYYHLMDRIRATDVKLYNYDMNRFYRKEDYDPLVHGLAFSKKTWTTNAHLHDKPMAFQRARAFSEKSEIRNKKSEISGQWPVVSGQEPSAVSCQPSAGSDQPSMAGDQCSVVCDQPSVVEFGVGGRDISEEFDARDEYLTGDDSEVSFESGDPDDDRTGGDSETGWESYESDDDWTDDDSETDCESGYPDDDWTDDDSETDWENDDPDDDSETDYESGDPDGAGTAEQREMPECVRILTQVMYRSRLHNLDYLPFTEKEMRFLAADPFFAEIEPRLAEQIRIALEEHDSGRAGGTGSP